MCQQPAGAVELVIFEGARLVLGIEHVLERKLPHLEHLPRAVLRRIADVEAAVVVEAQRGHRFGVTLDVPAWICGREMLHHEIVRVLVLHDAAGIERAGILTTAKERGRIPVFPDRHECHRISGSRHEEAGDARAAEKVADLAGVAEPVDRQLGGTALRLVVERQVLQRSHRPVEPFELPGVVPRVRLRVARLDDEVVGFGHPPILGGRRCRDEEGEQSRDQAQEHSLSQHDGSSIAARSARPRAIRRLPPARGMRKLTEQGDRRWMRRKFQQKRRALGQLPPDRAGSASCSFRSLHCCWRS
jgi:hypothetical protein